MRILQCLRANKYLILISAITLQPLIAQQEEPKDSEQDINRLKAAHELAQKKYDDTRAKYESGIISKNEFESCANELQNCEMRLAAAQKAYDTARAQAEELMVVAVKDRKAQELVDEWKDFASDFKVRMKADSRTNSIILAGPKKSLTAVETIIKQMDKLEMIKPEPSAKQLQLEIKLIRASTQKGEGEDAAAESIKKEVKTVEKIMKLKSYEVIDHVVVRVSNNMRFQIAAGAGTYSVSGCAQLSRDGLVLDNFSLIATLGGQHRLLETSLSVKCGEIAIVGLSKTQSDNVLITSIVATQLE